MAFSCLGEKSRIRDKKWVRIILGLFIIQLTYYIPSMFHILLSYCSRLDINIVGGRFQFDLIAHANKFTPTITHSKKNVSSISPSLTLLSFVLCSALRCVRGLKFSRVNCISENKFKTKMFHLNSIKINRNSEWM